jgi:uncharacterized protein YndB with AHSA1/START domain
MSTAAAVKPSLIIKRRFNAPPAKVFSAWTDAEKVKRWMGPDEVQVLSAEIDARTGGRYHWVMKAPNGEEHDVSGVYREVIPNEKLVFTWAWKSTPERESVVTLTFNHDGAGTLMTLMHEQFFDEQARDSHQGGWNGAMEKLEKFLA